MQWRRRRRGRCLVRGHSKARQLAIAFCELMMHTGCRKTCQAHRSNSGTQLKAATSSSDGKLFICSASGGR